MSSGDRTERAGEFADALGRLRRRGSALLVVGSTPESTHQRACRRMLGSSEQPRVVCRTDRTCTAGEELAGAGDHVVDLAVAARGAAATANGSTGPTAPGGGPERTVTDSVPAFGAAAAEAVETVADAGDDVRVCLDSLLPLVDAVGAERAFQLAHGIAADVSATGGVCHAHLPVDRDDDLGETFEALADATVELRLVADRPEQRWHIHDSVTSDWLPLDSR
jgi:hypothetical protein